MIISVVWLWKRIDRQKPDWVVHPQRADTDIYFEQLRLQVLTILKDKTSWNN
jgi:hypothetical protein